MIAQHESRSSLRQLLIARFDEGELETLCFDLGIDYDDLAGESKADKVRELLEYLVRRNALPELVRVGKATRPDIPWNQIAALDQPLADVSVERAATARAAGSGAIRLLRLDRVLVGAALVVALLGALAGLTTWGNQASERTDDQPAPTAAGAATSPPATAAIPTTPPATTTSATLAVQTVTVSDARDGVFHGSYGFFTRNGYLIAFVPLEIESVVVTWEREGQVYRARAEIVRRGGLLAPDELVLLKVASRDLPAERVAIRNSSSLQLDERVERYISATDSTPGMVIASGAEREVTVSSADGNLVQKQLRNVLVTTKISAAGDAGAPVIDGEGRVVAVVWGASRTETLSIAIEDLKVSFREAF